MTTVSSEGVIHLPKDRIDLYNHTVEILVFEKKKQTSNENFFFHMFNSNGKVKAYLPQEFPLEYFKQLPKGVD